jgi:hypothetical protein
MLIYVGVSRKTMWEVLSFQRDRETADEVAQECENFLAIPCTVQRTFLDRILRRWRVVCDRAGLEDGFVWEREP